MNESLILWNTISNLVATVALIAAIYLFFTKKKEYQYYIRQINEIQYRATKEIKRLYRNSENEAAEIKNKFDETLQSQKNIDRSLKNSLKTQSVIYVNLQNYKDMMIKIQEYQIELQNKIKEKDKIIGRKTMQIEKLKKAKK